jgi:hypothetical protein
MLWGMDTAYKSAALGRIFLQFLDATVGYLHSLASHSKNLLNKIKSLERLALKHCIKQS